MATILLSAVGAAVGSGFGGTVLGLSGAIIGRAVGATLGRVIDQRLLGAGSEAVETGRIERFRLTGASEGAPIAKVFGRARVAGQIIWATRFLEHFSQSGGGKGAPKPKVTTYSYSVSFAVALCEGQIASVGRIWADGAEVELSSLNLRIYEGSHDQLPDPKIEAVEGAGNAPAYRGTAYVVIEDLDLGRFGNRVPQFSFEVVRFAQGESAEKLTSLPKAVNAVALIPGTGEYVLATTALVYSDGPGRSRSVNVNSPTGITDFSTSLHHLGDELPQVKSVSLIVSWFGNDLRCGSCTIEPKVDQKLEDAAGMPWGAGGITRAQAAEVPKLDGRPVYGGTPTDASVVQAIQTIRTRGQAVMFYPFILMDQLAGNMLSDPWSDAVQQPALPWRGRITLSQAPGRAGSPDRSSAAQSEVANFMGTAQTSDFAIHGGRVLYSGPAEWKYRRFILHYAHLCALAGGVDAFCIGSEMRGLTQIRGEADSFPMVAALRQLAADVRSILGPSTKISYAADWTEYFGYQTEGNVYFHLDPLWADGNIDFIGIDNYMPISDWRDEPDHADSHWGAIYNLAYLKANIMGGEGYDWYYDSTEGRSSQRRLAIQDGAYGEPWVFRYKDLKSWWSNPHHQRINGVRSSVATPWVPTSKPIWFTEYGCPAVDKGTNEPNKFLDPKSSESSSPVFSTGGRDDSIQMHYLFAMHEVWTDPAHNPVSSFYPGQMVDMDRAHVWAWDARPFPHFPSNLALWSDGANYHKGHWLNGRATNQSLAAVVAELCERAGVKAFDVSRLYGVVRGYLPEGLGTARSALQPLMLAYGFDAVERDGVLRFQMRQGRKPHDVDRGCLVETETSQGTLETSRAPHAETAGRVRLSFIEAEGDFTVRQVETIFPDEESLGVSQSEMSLTLIPGEASSIVERWLAEARVSRDTARFALPRSLARIGAGDMVRLDGAAYRVDRLELASAAMIEAVRVQPSVYAASEVAGTRLALRAFVPPLPVFPVLLDLPLLTGDERPQAPYVAVTARPWQGPVAVWDAAADDGYQLNTLLSSPATLGMTLTELEAAPAGLWDNGAPVRVKLSNGSFASASELAVLNGANLVAIGDGASQQWEVFQFRQANLVGPETYELSLRLRGQFGTDANAPQVWPAGSLVILLDRSLVQLDLASSNLGLARHYRIGVASRGTDDRNVTHRVEAFAGTGLRPYSPVHLRARLLGNGDIHLSWIRRTRVDGDSWALADVPLGESNEQYLVRIGLNGQTLREVVVPAPTWTYTASLQASDGAGGTTFVEVAQLSERFGPGPFARRPLFAV